MIRHRDGGPRHNGTPGLPSSVPELARTLRRVRTRQGLRLEDVSVRGGLPLAQLEALESGTVDRMPDRVATVKVLRGYADFLGLSGDQFALALVDIWPTVPSAQFPIAAVHGSTGAVPPTGPPTVAVPGIGAAGAPTGQVASVTAALPGTPLTGAWPTTGTHPTGGPSGVRGLADTGVAPAVTGPPHRPRRRDRRSDRRDGAPLWLKGVVTVVVVAILVAAAGLIIQEVKPSWLRSLGITHAPAGGSGGSSGGGSGGGNTTTSSPRSTTSSAPPSGSGTLKPATTTATTATFDLRGATPTVAVAAVGNPSWVQVTATGQADPLFSGILQAGQTQSFPVHQSLVVEIGSSAAHLSAAAAGKDLGSYIPTVAPYTLTFNAAS
ncbi:MAG TPA: helix-turn-helix transcriptional regulator [Acidimicrobiales bacterium]|nr:helix-turn-helix transcriptional regulator [Acidimicrobiales bacterium]